MPNLLPRHAGPPGPIGRFCNSVRQEGFVGSVKELWAELDTRGDGFVGLEDFACAGEAGPRLPVAAGWEGREAAGPGRAPGWVLSRTRRHSVVNTRMNTCICFVPSAYPTRPRPALAAAVDELRAKMRAAGGGSLIATWKKAPDGTAVESGAPVGGCIAVPSDRIPKGPYFRSRLRGAALLSAGTAPRSSTGASPAAPGWRPSRRPAPRSSTPATRSSSSPCSTWTSAATC